MLCRGQRGVKLIYFYFCLRTYEEEGYKSLVCSLISQILAECESVPEGLLYLFQECCDLGKEPEVGRLVPLLQQILGEYSASYVVLDALDECDYRGNVLDMISTLMNGRIPGLHILITGRELQSALRDLCTDSISIGSQIKPDISLFVQDSLRNRPGLRNWPIEVKTEIEETLVSKAGGLYVLRSKST